MGSLDEFCREPALGRSEVNPLGRMLDTVSLNLLRREPSGLGTLRRFGSSDRVSERCGRTPEAADGGMGALGGTNRRTDGGGGGDTGWRLRLTLWLMGSGMGSPSEDSEDWCLGWLCLRGCSVG